MREDGARIDAQEPRGTKHVPKRRDKYTCLYTTPTEGRHKAQK